MGVDVTIIINALAATAVYSTLIPIALGGGLTYFKPWLLSEEQIRERVGLQKEILVERLSTSLNRILQQVRDTEIPLRGDPPNHEDFVANYASETFRLFRVFNRLDSLHISVKQKYSVLFITALVSLVFFLIALPIASIRPYLALLCYIIIIIQIYAAYLIRSLGQRLEEYENET